MTTLAKFEIDSSPAAVQRIIPQSRSERFEGVDFSPSGDTLAIATSETNHVLLFRRKADGRFEETPYQTIGETPAGLKYPHDVAFSTSESAGLLAVAQRGGTISIYAKNGSAEGYAATPAFEISGPRSGLAFSDGVAFVPPDDAYIAACNLELATISFFRRLSVSPPRFETGPEFVLRHRSIFHPDGLGFSRCGTWLAIANHGKQTVSIFRRRKSILGNGKLRYGPWPVTVIADPRLHYPHSVAFTPRTNHLIVTNAGANYFNAYAPRQGLFGTRWSPVPVSQVIAHDDAVFREVNTADKTEGGPKGVAVHGTTLAVCSPQIGIKIYSFREG